MGIVKGGKSRKSYLFVGGLLSVGIAYFSHLCPILAKSTPVIHISSGQVQGRVGHSLRSGNRFWQFLSIPFAEPPVGRRRFEPPEPVAPWKGVKKVISYPPHCLQYDALVLQQVQGVEDCLFLNVFVSSPPEEDKMEIIKPDKPVLVFIHGGGFLSSGSRTYHPDFFMDQDNLVLVTLNYRLGPFGFFNLAQEEADNCTEFHLPRGNMGLKDQKLALEWIQKNIAHFGGDPNRVTIMGESAGAASVHLHVISPKSRGLFHKAIAISGSAYNSWAMSDNARDISLKYSKSMGCPVHDKEQHLKCLQELDAHELVKLQQVLQKPTVENDLLVPSVESYELSDTFLKEHPLQIVKNGGHAKVPMIMGVNSGEGGLITARFDAMPQIIQSLDKIWPSKISSFTSGLVKTVSPSIANKIRGHYFGSNATFSSMPQGIFQNSLSKLSSDSLFFIPAHKAALQHAASGAPTYFYYFDYKATLLPSTYSGFRAVTPNDIMIPSHKVVVTMVTDWIVEHTVGKSSGPRRFGISHAEDLYQTWNLEGITGYFTGPDKEFSDALVKTLVQFARRDDENVPLSFRGVQWPALNQSNIEAGEDEPFPCILLDNKKVPEMVLEPYAESLDFWASLNS